jgi:branched-chain amino acid transport system permease protein
MDIYLVEAVINGILLGGVLALLALGLNLIFGVMDVVWIAYADIVMCGMYAIYFLHAQYGVPLPLTFAIAIVGVSGLGVLVHLLIIAPVLNSPPLNQLAFCFSCRALRRSCSVPTFAISACACPSSKSPACM